MRGRRGFTIFELLVALAILSIVAALAVPAYFDRHEVTLENAATQLARDLRATQNRAAYLGTAAELAFLDDGDGYRILEGTDSPFGSEPREHHLRRYSRDGVFEGVRIERVELGAEQRAVAFDPRGRALHGGRITLGFDGETRTVAIQRGTGLISIADSSSGWRDDGL